MACPSSSATRMRRGSSRATDGEASISGVPAFGLPKTTTCVSGMVRPDPMGGAAVVEPGKDLELASLQGTLQPIERLRKSVAARPCHDAFGLFDASHLVLHATSSMAGSRRKSPIGPPAPPYLWGSCRLSPVPALRGVRPRY